MYAWDSTALGAFKTCPRLYYYTIIEGYQPIGEAIHLRFGIEYHKALEWYDKTRALGEDHDTALNSTVHELLIRTADFNPTVEEYGKAARYKNRRTLLRTVIWYLDKYPAEKDPAQTHILENGKAAVELSFRFELDWGPSAKFDPDGNSLIGSFSQPYLLCGHLDRVVNYQDSLFFMDRKTTTSTPGDYFFDQFNPHNQMTIYNIAAQVVLDSPVRGGIIDCAQIQLEASEFKRGFVYRTQGQIEEWLDDLHYWFDLAEDCATKENWPMNDTACDKFGGCAFREVCRKDPKVRSNYLKGGFVQLPVEERWNPLAPR